MAFDFVGFYHDIILNKVVTAAIIFFLGFMLGKISGNLSKRFFEDVGLNRRTTKTFFGRMNTEKILSTAISFLIYIGTIIMALNKLGLTGIVLKSMILFVILLLLATLFLDLQDLFPNLYAWVKIKKNKYFSENDRIKTPLAEGVVKKITPLTTRIITDHDDELYLQNSAVLENLSVTKKKS